MENEGEMEGFTIHRTNVGGAVEWHGVVVGCTLHTCCGVLQVPVFHAREPDLAGRSVLSQLDSPPDPDAEWPLGVGLSRKHDDSRCLLR